MTKHKVVRFMPSCLVFFAVLLLASGLAFASITNCTNISSSGSYSLTTNLSSNGTCILINASNVTLDCQNYWIEGNGTRYSEAYSTGFGILTQDVSNVTIQNCNITNFTDAVLLNRTNNSLVTDGNMSNNARSAVYLDYSQNNTVQNILADYVWHYNENVNGTDCNDEGFSNLNPINTSAICGHGFLARYSPNSSFLNNHIQATNS